MRTAWISLGLVMTSTAWAQPAPEDPTAEVAEIFNYDRLLLATLQPVAPVTQAQAEALFAAFSERLRKNNDVLPMAEVPYFDVHGYDAQQYMNACPTGDYTGCALVIGQRVEADWVIGGVVTEVTDEFEEGVSKQLVTVHFIDVANATVVATFGVLFDGTQDGKAIDGIAHVYNRMVQGDFDNQDLRGDLGDPEAAKALEKARADRIAQGLAELEEQLGVAVRTQVARRVDPPKITKRNLAEYAQREERPPWERVGMSQREYLRFANSGKDLETWRRTGYGRFGQLLLRAGFGGGGGPWHQQYEGKMLLSDLDLQPVQSVQYNEVINAGSTGVDFELGLGVAPWVEVSFALGNHFGGYTYTIDDDVIGQVSIPGQEAKSSITTWQYGLRTSFAPGPRWPARPTLGAGVAWWKGANGVGSERFTPLGAPTLTLLEILPGAEVSAHKNLNLFLRGVFSLPVGGTSVLLEEEGAGLEGAPKPSEEMSMGTAVQAGVQVRIGPFFKIDTKTKSSIRTEEERMEAEGL